MQSCADAVIQCDVVIEDTAVVWNVLGLSALRRCFTRVHSCDIAATPVHEDVDTV